MATLRQQHGMSAEKRAEEYLALAGWKIVARNVRVGVRDEIDIVAVDPGPPQELVCVEVRSASSRNFGSPEERVDRRKIAHLYRAMFQLQVDRSLPRRIDLVVVDTRTHPTEIRHLRRLEPS